MSTYAINILSGGSSYDPTNQHLVGISGVVNGGNITSNWAAGTIGMPLVKQDAQNAIFSNTLTNMSLVNPTTSGKETFGSVGASEITQLFSVLLSNNTPTGIFTIPIDDNSVVGFDVDLSGISKTTTDATQLKLFLAWSRRGGAPVALGSQTSSDPRNTGSPASGWSATLGITGNSAKLTITSDATLAVNWIAIVKYRINTIT